MTDRPRWNFSLTERQFETLLQDVKMITHQWQFTSEDTSEHWIEFTFYDGKKIKAPERWRELFEFTERNHRSLIQPNYQGENAVKVLTEIKAWEKKNSRDLAEYMRLKAKFGDL